MKISILLLTISILFLFFFFMHEQPAIFKDSSIIFPDSKIWHSKRFAIKPNAKEVIYHQNAFWAILNENIYKKSKSEEAWTIDYAAEQDLFQSIVSFQNGVYAFTKNGKLIFRENESMQWQVRKLSGLHCDYKDIVICKKDENLQLWILTSNFSNNIVLYEFDLNTDSFQRKELTTLHEINDYPLKKICASPNGDYVWVISDKHIFTIHDYNCTFIFSPPTILNNISCSKDGKSIYAVGNKGTICISNDYGYTWNFDTPLHSDVDLLSVSISDNGKYIWIAGTQGSIVASHNRGKDWSFQIYGEEKITAEITNILIDAESSEVWIVGKSQVKEDVTKSRFIKDVHSFSITSNTNTLGFLISVNEFKKIVGKKETPSLRGAAADMDGLGNILVEKFHFSENNILRLHGELATRQNILDGFSKLIEVTKNIEEDFVVVIGISSCGSTIPDINGDEPDALDETICTYDRAENGDIVDDEIYYYLNQILQNSHAYIHFIVDASFQKSISKTFDEEQNTIDKVAEPADIYVDVSYTKENTIDLNNQRRFVSFLLPELGVAKEKTFSQQPKGIYGVLTHSLLNVLDNASLDLLVWRDLVPRWNSLDVSLQAVGNIDLHIFGTNIKKQPKPKLEIFAITPLKGLEETEFTVQANDLNLLEKIFIGEHECKKNSDSGTFLVPKMKNGHHIVTIYPKEDKSFPYKDPFVYIDMKLEIKKIPNRNIAVAFATIDQGDNNGWNNPERKIPDGVEWSIAGDGFIVNDNSNLENQKSIVRTTTKINSKPHKRQFVRNKWLSIEEGQAWCEIVFPEPSECTIRVEYEHIKVEKKIVWQNDEIGKDVQSQIKFPFNEDLDSKVNGKKIVELTTEFPNTKIIWFNRSVKNPNKNFILSTTTDQNGSTFFEMLSHNSEKEYLIAVAPQLEIITENKAFGRVQVKKQLQLLWIDDDWINGENSHNENERQLIENMDIHVEKSTSTENALQMVAQKKYDIIISDMRRGKNSVAGYDLLEKLQNEKIHIPFIIYSTSINPKDDKEAKEKGALGNASNFEQLKEYINSVLE